MEPMTALTSAIAESSHVVNELPMPSFMFGVIAFVALMALAVATWTFRNVSEKAPQSSRVLPPEAPLDADDAAGHTVR